MREKIIEARGYPAHIAGDALSLKISSYQSSADYLAQRLQGNGKIVCELCCGIGVSLVALAPHFTKVIGVDNDHGVLTACKQNLDNAKLHNYELIEGDVSSPEILEKITADIVSYDIPYWNDHSEKANEKLNPDLASLIATIRQKNITNNIVIYTPPHFSYDKLPRLLAHCEFVEVFIDGKHDRNFLFLGDLIERPGKHQIRLKM